MPLRLFALFALVAVAACANVGSQPQAVTSPSHHNPAGGFRNPEGSLQRQASWWELQKFIWSSLLAGSYNDPIVPQGHGLTEAEAAHGWQTSTGDKLQWLGHSAFRWTLGGTTILSDPLLTDRASPFTWAGPKRYVPSPLAPEQAMADVVLISHNHYDHLDTRTLARLPNKETVTVVVPLGVAPVVRKEAGIPNVVELDWGQTIRVKDVSVTLLPAVHFSSRWLNDRNATLWGGFKVEGNGKNIYVSGDTAYHPTMFKEIGKAYGPFDYGIIAVGAYEPRRIMIASHVTPEEAVMMAKDVRAKTVIGQHWGAIRLTTEDAFEPPERFAKVAKKEGLADGDVWLMKVGETRSW